MKYLIEIHHGIGDIVQMTGVIESIRRYDKNAYIALIINKDVYKSLFACDYRVNKFYRIDMVGMTKMELFKEVMKMRREHFDYFLVSPISNRRAIQVLALTIGAKSNHGEQFAGVTKIFARYKAVELEDVHIVKRNENVLRSVDMSFEKCTPRLCCVKELPVEIPEKAIAICIGTSIPQKTWPLEKYLQVAEHFASKGYQIVLLGGEKERNLYAESGTKNSDWINLMGKLNLIESASVAQKCKVVIGGDTGVMHMAAAVGATTLTLFSCTDPTLHAPYSKQSYYYNVEVGCQFCYERGEVDKCENFKCLNWIEVQDITAVTEEILSECEGERLEKYHFSLE